MPMNFGDLKQYLTSTKRDKDGRKTSNVPNQPRQRSQARQNEANAANSSHRRSVFGMEIGSPFKPKRKDPTTAKTDGDQSNQRRKSKISPRDQHMHDLHHDRDGLSENNENLRKEIGRRMADLEALKAQNEEEKWEDELYGTRLKELKSAQAVIDTRSTSGHDVIQLVKQLNEQVGAIASLAAGTPIVRDAQQGGLENITTFLGEGFPISFRNSGDRLDDQGLVRVILQVFLAQECVELIDSWYLGQPGLSSPLNEFYNRIRSKEEQRVAGKWRQITFAQLPRGSDNKVLRDHAAVVASKLMHLSSCAGWGGDIQEIQPRVEGLMKGAEAIRISVKEVLFADLQVWVATYGARFEPTDMKNVGDDFGLQHVEDTGRCHVLGSTEVGLKARRSGGDVSPESKELRSRSRVVLVESLGRQYRPPRR